MKYVTYESNDGPRVGVLEGDTVLDAGFDGDMVAFIEAGAPVEAAGPVHNVRLLAPLRPRTLRDFLTFEGHLKNAFGGLGKPIPEEWYSVPAYYKGLPDTVIGPGEEIPWPAYTDRLDHELELAAVIGREGKDISVADAPEHIFGYTIWNDMSARDVQQRAFAVLGIDDSEAKEKFGFLLEAFKYGPPPHGGIAFGWDRIVMLLAGANSLRDVIAFPKTGAGQDPLTGAPTPITAAQRDEAGVDFVPEDEPETE